eukprot:TRINITY_DN1230_c0_g2_i3.p1 TRINITY_DN1230_c0_g2~~TRINITY_DN1230_c0_g2_i3.p1  ORF type:complete len:203 (+),score=56.11 TRINITY_DN1230_c0_g2_i3:55-663(+)
MVFHVFDLELAKEWAGTLKEYCGFIIKPFSAMGFMEIWNPMRTDKLEEWFQTWSVLQFWWAILINIASAIILLLLIDMSFIGAAIQNSVIGIFSAFIYAHLGWFSVAKKNGCCCFLVVCISDMPIIYLIYGIWLIAWGALTVVNSLSWISLAALGFVYTICYGSYCIPMIYMGIVCIRIFLTKKDNPTGSGANEVVIGKQEA